MSQLAERLTCDEATSHHNIDRLDGYVEKREVADLRADPIPACRVRFITGSDSHDVVFANYEFMRELNDGLGSAHPQNESSHILGQTLDFADRFADQVERSLHDRP